MRKELIIYLDTNEEGLEVNIRKGVEENSVCFSYEGMRFIIDSEELIKALQELKKFKDS